MYKLKLGGVLVCFIVLAALCAPLLTYHNPQDINLSERYRPPSLQHFFGQDEQGKDVFSQVVYGARTSLSISLMVVFLTAFLGLILGSLSGYFGGYCDRILMILVDIFYAFPGFLLALAIMAVLEPSAKNIIIALCLTSWAGFARLMRGEVLHLKEKEYVQSTVALGFHPFRTLVKHIWPNLMGLLVIQMALALGGIVVAESSLSFLGLGVPDTVASWGNLLSSGREFLLEAPHISLFPGLAILILVLGFNLLGEGLRDVLDKKQ